MRAAGRADDVGEREAGSAIANGAIDQLLNGQFGDRLLDAETRCVRERQDVDERPDVVSGRLAQRHGPSHQSRERVSPVGGTRDVRIGRHCSVLFGHTSAFSTAGATPEPSSTFGVST